MTRKREPTTADREDTATARMALSFAIDRFVEAGTGAIESRGEPPKLGGLRDLAQWIEKGSKTQGRRRGSKTDDEANLARVAELLATNRSLRLGAACRFVEAEARAARRAQGAASSADDGALLRCWRRKIVDHPVHGPLACSRIKRRTG